MFTKCLVAVAILGLAGSALAEPVVTTFQQNHNGYTGEEDATYNIRSTDLGDVNGSYMLTHVGVASATAEYFTLLKFNDLFGPTAMDYDLGVTNATLRFYNQYNLQTGHSRTLEAYQMLTPAAIADHTGSAVDGEASQAYRAYDSSAEPGSEVIAYWGYRNRQESGPVIGVDCSAIPVGQFELNGELAGEWIEIDVTAAVEAWRTGSGNFGLMLRAVGEPGYTPYLALGSADYPLGYDREPKLTVTQDVIVPNPPFLMGDANGDGVVSAGDYAAVQANFGNTNLPAISSTPEPATVSLLAVGLLGIVRRNKR